MTRRGVDAYMAPLAAQKAPSLVKGGGLTCPLCFRGGGHYPQQLGDSEVAIPLWQCPRRSGLLTWFFMLTAPNAIFFSLVASIVTREYPNDPVMSVLLPVLLVVPAVLTFLSEVEFFGFCVDMLTNEEHKLGFVGRHIMAVRDRHELRNRFGNKRFIGRVIVSIFQTQLQASDIARGQRFIKQRSEFGHM